MAPIAVPVIETTTGAVATPLIATKQGTGDYKEQAGGKRDYDKNLEEQGENKARYQNYLPIWDPNEHHPPLEPFTHTEHGIEADLSFPDLLGPNTQTEELTPLIGSSVSGVQLSKLNDAGKAQLAAFTAQRKVVVFKDQDFADLPIQDALDFGGYFGRHHIHPTSGAPKGYPEIHLVHRGINDKLGDELLESRISTVTWHSDVTYEKQPPGTTFLYIFDKPGSGGDTAFANTAEAYRRLSPAMRERLHGLKALHSGIEQADSARSRGSVVRRDPVTSVHPVIRTHPITGEKAIFVNHQFTRHIIGLKKEESDVLLKFLNDHIAQGIDFHARIKWSEKAVVVWDNRVTNHSAILDWVNGQRRHLARITPQAEPPYETPYDTNNAAAEKVPAFAK